MSQPSTTGAGQPLVLPAAVQQHLRENPEVLTSLLRPESIAEMLRSKENLANWCVACGASSGVAAEALRGNPNPVELSDNHIEELSRRILSGLGGAVG